MSRNRLRYRNGVRPPVVVALLLVTAGLIGIGLSQVHHRNFAHALADEQREVEKEIRLLRQEISALDLRIESLLTRDKIQPRLTKARTLLRPITKERLIYLPPDAPSPSPPSIAQAPQASP
jgi:hypothetical protein